MAKSTFKALVIEETSDGKFSRTIRERQIADLPEGDLLVRVHYSSLNYKDALSASGNRGVTRNYPHTPGIDAAGVVAASNSEGFQVGESVIVTSYDLGMNTDGGFGEYIRVPAAWAVKLPAGLSLRESMIYGTAGFTAAMCVHGMARDVAPGDGQILVSGATGGVGSVAVALLAKLGYQVAGVTGKPEGESFLKSLGAASTLSREAATDDGKRPMTRGVWAGAVDTVGGEILASAIRAAKPLATVTCCGNAASPKLPLTVFPFILRGVRLVGIDSQNCPMALRQEIWQNLAADWKIPQLENLCKEITLEKLSENIDLILAGGQQGRVIVNLEG